MMEFLSLEPQNFGLDISDFSLKIAGLKKKGKFLRLASWGEVGIKEGIVQGGEIKDEEALAGLIKGLIAAVDGEKISTKKVVISLPENKSFLQVIQMPKMEESDLRAAIQFEAENYVPLPLAEVCLDFQIVPPLSNHLDHFDILLAASPKNIVDSYVSCLKKAGLDPYIIEIESQSIARSLVKKGISPSPSLLVDFGRSATVFIIYSGYSIRFTSTVPLSSLHLDQAISKSLGVDLAEAEKLKLDYIAKEVKTKKEDIGTENKNSKNKKIFEAMTPVLSDLASQIKKYLNYYQTHKGHEHLAASDKKVGKIILCGGGANLAGLADFLSASLKIQVELGNPWINILPEPLKKVPEISFKDSLGYAAAFGLALRGLPSEKND